MKTYKIKLMTPAGIVTETYTDSQELTEFEQEMTAKHGTFITLEAQEIEALTVVDAAKILLIAVKNGDLTIFPASETTPDYIQMLENAVNKES